MPAHPSLVTGHHETLCPVANSGSDELPTCSLFTFPVLLLLPCVPIHFPDSYPTFSDPFPEPHLPALGFAAYVAVPLSVFSSG